MCFRQDVDVTNKDEVKKIVKSSIGTKFIKKWSDLACDMALSAVETVALETGDRKEIDIKRYAKVEKVHPPTHTHTHTHTHTLCTLSYMDPIL